MSRDSNGTFSLGVGNPVVTLTTIASAWANGTFTDVAQEITNSLDRNGRGAMLAQFKAFDGTVLAPGISWGSEVGSGLYRAGAGDTRAVVAGVRVAGFDANGLNTTDGAVAPAYQRVGFRDIPQVSQSAAYTLLVSDAGKHVYHPGTDTTARVWTIPANASVAFPIGAALTFINDTGGGVITIAITTDTLVLAGAGTTGSRTLAANGVATAVKMTATRWIISGTGLT